MWSFPSYLVLSWLVLVRSPLATTMQFRLLAQWFLWWGEAWVFWCWKQPSVPPSQFISTLDYLSYVNCALNSGMYSLEGKNHTYKIMPSLGKLAIGGKLLPVHVDKERIQFGERRREYWHLSWSLKDNCYSGCGDKPISFGILASWGLIIPPDQEVWFLKQG